MHLYCKDGRSHMKGTEPGGGNPVLKLAACCSTTGKFSVALHLAGLDNWEPIK
jgi:hypothetical protein